MTDQPSDTPSRLFKPEEAARFLCISTRTLGRLIKKGELPHVRVGCSMRFVMADLLAYVASHRRWGGD